MTYLLKTDNQSHHIMHVETDECVGYLKPLKRGFILYRALTDGRKKIAVINSVDEAVPTLAAYNEKHPPQWMGGAKARCHNKWTFYGVLKVERQARGEWTVERSRELLACGGAYAVFPTAEEAKHMADIHMCDGFPNSVPVDDGFSWDDCLTRVVYCQSQTSETKVSSF
jgi:hypothetical protein